MNPPAFSWWSFRWELKDQGSGIHGVAQTFIWSNTGSAADGTAFTVFLATLNTAPCFAGHCDWRMPNVKELQSIADYSRINPASSVPGSTTADPYWSSTTFAGDSSDAWNLIFNFGTLSVDLKSTAHRVRAVRGSQ